MMQSYIFFNAPPQPYYLESGFQIHEIGDSHPNRSNIGLFDFIIVKEGCLHIGENQEQWSLHAGQSIILLPDQYHYAVHPATERTTFYWVHFRCVGNWIQSNQEYMKLPLEEHQYCFNPSSYTIQLAKQSSFSYTQPLFQLLEEMNEAGKERETTAFWKKQHAFEQLLKLLDIRQHDNESSAIVRLAEQVENYIRNHFQEEITNEILSSTFHYHYNYITRALKQMYGYTPNEYVMKVRIDQAKSLLLNTRMNISTIAEQVGFENIPYFSNCFTKHTGLSPTSYRNQYFE